MSLSTALSPVAARLIAQFGGATARFRVSTPQRQADASSVSTWADVAGLTAAPIVIEDLGTERALKRWGAEAVVHAEGTVAVPVGVVLPDRGLACAITSGPRTGVHYTIVKARVD